MTAPSQPTSVVPNNTDRTYPHQPLPLKNRSDVPFYLVTGGLASCFVVLILLLLVADVAFTSLHDFRTAIGKPEILASIRLTLLTCTVSAIASIWVATPLAYVLTRFRFFGRSLVELLADIPLVLPPLVLGLSLLILFHWSIGSGADAWTLESWLRDRVGFPVTHRWPAIILAQFCVACAFAVRMMRATFEQMDPRAEQVAQTLGCNRGQAFFQVALPQASRGMLAATTIAWARSLGEFGPILVFAGATRMRTEVLSTSVYLELSVGELGSAVAVSLLMVGIAVAVLIALRSIGEGMLR
ncbi:Sulfate transport system permease protein CysW [Rubripirellula lacrimiformis]|uniref:Sulfate transport system permease protein CysW n=1 Tax=Rubripirellula lacrimiformis TaxID=1930273 RepID=A0A517NJ01_9BACT|nr:ABC transporter permease [Rubripirellula lacrimiformis]QDT07119.1 Sulfate transport system permease protein CysW [Rubripirellula lacrimiformis]